MPRSFCVCCCMCLGVCVGAYMCAQVFVLSKFEFDWKACDTAAANRQHSPHSAILCASARLLFTWRRFLLTLLGPDDIDDDERLPFCVLHSASGFLRLSLSPSLWFPGNVVCSLDNVERCASFGAQAWLLTLPHVAVRCGVVRRQRCVFACQMVLYRFLVPLPAPLPPYLCIPFSIPAN